MKLLSLTIIAVSACFLPVKAQPPKKANSLPSTLPVRTITADFTSVKGPTSKMFDYCIGAGRANEGLRADWQQQLKFIKEQVDFKYIRMHGLLTDDMGVYREDKTGTPIYNWQYIDVLFDFLLSIKIKPFVELGFMPEALASGKKTIFWWRANVTPPKDYKKWEGLIRALTLHFQERYGHDEVKTWYFEVWNEPNLKDLFFTGDMNEYFKMYESSAKAIKSVSTDYRVGGPATAGSAWIPEFIDFCAKNNVPVDFASTHTYGVKSGFVDPDGTTGTILSQNKNAVSSEIINSRKQIRESARPNLELHYTEWSSSYTPTDPIHDSYHQAAYILDKIKNSGDAPTSMSYWVFTDIFEENGPRATPFHGGFGLLNYQSIKKPAFYAYQFLNRLGEEELSTTDAASWVCKNKNGGMQALFWDFTITHPGDSVNNQVYYKRDLPSKDKETVKLEIKNVPAGNYKMSVYKTGYRVNDVYATYMDLRSPGQLSVKEVERINKINNGEAVIKKEVKVDKTGSFTTDVLMRENDVVFLVMERE